MSNRINDTNYIECSADKALDGQKTYQENGQANALCTTCSIAAAAWSDAQQWWQLNLQGKYLIGTIIVTGRMGMHITIFAPKSENVRTECLKIFIFTTGEINNTT